MPPRHTWQAHLLGTPGSTTASKLHHLKDYQAGRKWLVTGTPFSTGLDQLMNQADLIGHLTRGARVAEMQVGIARPNWVKPPCPAYYTASQWAQFGPEAPCDKMKNEAITDRLRSVMIRHTKGQRIGGEVALALPDSLCSTTWLDMTPDEKLLYDLHHCVQWRLAPLLASCLHPARVLLARPTACCV